MGLRTLSTVGIVENPVTAHETAEASKVLVNARLLKMTGPGTRNNGMNSNLNQKLVVRLEVCGSLVGQAYANPHLRTVTFGVGSEAQVNVMSLDTASGYPSVVARKQPCETAQESQGKAVEDIGDK